VLAAPVEQPLRRVILLSCDTLSALHMPAYGYDLQTTAAFDSLAAEGVLFRNCLVPQVWTLTSHMSMLTGLDPGVHRVGGQRKLSPAILTLTEILAASGFLAAAFPATNSWLSPQFGFGRGFEKYQFFEITEPVVERVGRWCGERIRFRGGPRSPARPFFLFLHYMDVHSRPVPYPFPYYPVQAQYRKLLPEPGVRLYEKHLLPQQTSPGIHRDNAVRQWDLAKYDPDLLRIGYDSCIVSWDHERLRAMLLELRRAGFLRDTLIIVTADHGEEIADHGGFLHNQPYGEVRRVPLLLIWPGRLPRGAVVDRRVSVTDLAPTILDLAGLEPLPHCQGLSLRPLLADPDAPFPARDFLIDGHHRGYKLELSALVARARDRWWSLIAETDTTGCLDTFRPERVASVRGLFDLDADPFERTDLAPAHPELVTELRQRLDEQFAANARLAALLVAGWEEGPEELSADQMRQLRALGY